MPVRLTVAVSIEVAAALAAMADADNTSVTEQIRQSVSNQYGLRKLRGRRGYVYARFPNGGTSHPTSI